MTKDDRETMFPGAKVTFPPGSSAEQVKALNRIAAALERLADVYLYVNDPDPEEQGIATTSLSQVPKL